MSLSLIVPRRPRTDGCAPPRPESLPRDNPKGSRTARATQADAIWILAAAVVFVGFQVIALLTHGP
ncbi:MAG: hypothetical protein O3A96_14175 [Proteobacteria bacterium]|nr:hypothetical protein [Pseudomonadota bacterium]